MSVIAAQEGAVVAGRRTALAIGVVALVTLNLSWAHQTLLQMVDIPKYYSLAVGAPFIYRALPAVIYHALSGGAGVLTTGLNAPFDSAAAIFQLGLDWVSLMLTWVFMVRITRALNPTARTSVIVLFTAVIGGAIVVFGFLTVPNRSLFYPYDFPDLCFAAIIFWLGVRPRGRGEFWLPVAVFVASLNKETALFYSGVYLAMRLGPTANGTSAQAGQDIETNWVLTAVVLASSLLATVLARACVIWLIGLLAPGTRLQGSSFEVHWLYTVQQLRNPAFVVALLGICSYLYIPVFMLRRRLDRTDWLILGMIGLWAAIMCTVGIVRELRIFAPASLLMFVILARHLRTIATTIAPDTRPVCG